MRNLGDHISVLSGFAFKSESFNTEENGMPLIRIRDVVKGKTQTFYDGPYDSKYVIRAGDLLVGMDGEFNCNVWSSGDALLNQRVCKIIPNSSIDFRFLFHVLPRHLKIIEDKTPFVTVKHLSVKDINQIKLHIPDISEQKRIASILDKADTIRSKREKAIELIDSFLKSVFLVMFGNPSYNPQGFDQGTIRDLVSEVKYGTSGKAGSAGKYEILRMNNITYSGDLDLSSLKYIDLEKAEESKYLTKKGDLLFNRTNSKELVGKTAVYYYEKPRAIAGYLIRVRPNSCAKIEYISAYLNSRHGKDTLQHMCKSIVGMANINAQELQDITILIPPIDLQNRFAEIVEKVRQTKFKLLQSLNETERLAKSLSNLTIGDRNC